jgi:basic membrane protein A
MKKFLALLLALVLVFALVGCSGTNDTTPSPTATTPAPDPTDAPSDEPSDEPEDDTLSIYMITDKGDINDKSFNQGTWEGIEAWVAANEGATCEYLKPGEATDTEYINSIEQAIQAGADVVVTPGYLFANPITAVQEQYPDVTFIFIDGIPEFVAADNTVCILFQEEQAGYLAGYAAVMDGHTKLGFLGGQAVPAVVRYGYGYVQGASDAAAELGITVDMMYTNTDGFAATPEAQAMAASWYQAGTTVIFGCGGSVGNSVFAAAEAEGGKSIGVDVDQYAESETIITSSMKDLGGTVGHMLDAYVAGTFPGGQTVNLGAADHAVALPMANSRFETFDQAAYDTLFEKLGGLTLKVDTDAESADQLGVTNCNVTVVAQ